MQLGAAKNTATNEDEYLAVIRAKTAELFAAACEVGPVLAGKNKSEHRGLPVLRHEPRHRVPTCRRRARLRRQVGQARQECRRRFPRGQDHAAGGAVVPARLGQRARVLEPHARRKRRPGRRSRTGARPDGQASRHRGYRRARAPLWRDRDRCAGAGAAVADQDGAGRDGRVLHRARCTDAGSRRLYRCLRPPH